MKTHHVKRIWTRPLWMNWKKHFCPACGELLQKTQITKIVNSQSEEANAYDFSSPGGDGYMVGNVKFIRTAFSCEKCGKCYSVNEIHQAEKADHR